MDTKLPLKLDKDIIARAKKYAFSRRVSLSTMIENYLAALTSEKAKDPKILPFVKSITSGEKIDDGSEWKEKREDYIEYLERKYK